MLALILFSIFALIEILLFAKVFLIGFTDYESSAYGLLFSLNTIIFALLGLIAFFF